MKIKLAIVDDRKEYAETLKCLLEFYDEMEDIQLYHSAEEFIAAFKEQSSDVVLMDIGLPGISGTECIRKLKPLKPKTQFIAFTVFVDDKNVFDALCAGATGYVLKSETADQLFEAIKNVYKGGSPMSSSISRMVINYFSQLPKKTPRAELTRREIEVLELLASGKRYREIADFLIVSIDTIRTHIQNIYQKLEVSNKVEAINKYKK